MLKERIATPENESRATKEAMLCKVRTSMQPCRLPQSCQASQARRLMASLCRGLTFFPINNKIVSVVRFRSNSSLNTTRRKIVDSASFCPVSQRLKADGRSAQHPFRVLANLNSGQPKLSTGRRTSWPGRQRRQGQEGMHCRPRVRVSELIKYVERQAKV